MDHLNMCNYGTTAEKQISSIRDVQAGTEIHFAYASNGKPSKITIFQKTRNMGEILIQYKRDNEIDKVTGGGPSVAATVSTMFDTLNHIVTYAKIPIDKYPFVY
jgi:hypothetical protein